MLISCCLSWHYVWLFWFFLEIPILTTSSNMMKNKIQKALGIWGGVIFLDAEKAMSAKCPVNFSLILTFGSFFCFGKWILLFASQMFPNHPFKITKLWFSWLELASNVQIWCFAVFRAATSLVVDFISLIFLWNWSFCLPQLQHQWFCLSMSFLIPNVFVFFFKSSF